MYMTNNFTKAYLQVFTCHLSNIPTEMIIVLDWRVNPLPTESLITI